MGISNGMIYLTQQAYIGQVLPKEKNNALQLDMSRAMVIGAPCAVLISFFCSFCDFKVGQLDVTGLTAPGILLSIVFMIQLIASFLMFEEIPQSWRRLPLNTNNAYVDNSRLTPYISPL